MNLLDCQDAPSRPPLHIALILLAGCPSPEQQAADIFTEAQLFVDEGEYGKTIACYGLPDTLSGDTRSIPTRIQISMQALYLATWKLSPARRADGILVLLSR